MESMEKIGGLKIISLFILALFLLSSCKTNDFLCQVEKNHKLSKKVYHKYLKKYGNASMILPEGNFSVIWYYENHKIYITRIRRAKVLSVQEYDCKQALDIKDYKRGCYHESLDADLFRSSFFDTETDSLYDIGVCLEIEKLKKEGSDCRLLKDLRDQIILYKLWE